MTGLLLRGHIRDTVEGVFQITTDMGPSKGEFYQGLYEEGTLQRKSHLCILFWELHGLRINFHIQVSESDLYIPRIGPHISCSRIGRSILGIYKSLTDT
jgi:hypothetical protein